MHPIAFNLCFFEQKPRFLLYSEKYYPITDLPDGIDSFKSTGMTSNRKSTFYRFQTARKQAIVAVDWIDSIQNPDGSFSFASRYSLMTIPACVPLSPAEWNKWYEENES